MINAADQLNHIYLLEKCIDLNQWVFFPYDGTLQIHVETRAVACCVVLNQFSVIGVYRTDLYFLPVWWFEDRMYLWMILASTAGYLCNQGNAPRTSRKGRINDGRQNYAGMYTNMFNVFSFTFTRWRYMYISQYVLSRPYFQPLSFIHTLSFKTI